MHGNQVVAKLDASGCLEGVDLDVLKASEAVEMRDGIADFGERQRIAAVSLDQIEKRRLTGRAPLDDDLDVGDDAT